jgi:MFS family permease
LCFARFSGALLAAAPGAIEMAAQPVAATPTPAPVPPMRLPAFRRFWMARFLANTAQNAILLALLVVVVNRTGSTIHSSLLVLTFIIPAALLGVVGGVVVDHLPMRPVLTLSCLLRALLCVGFLKSNESVWVIYAVNLALSAVVQFSGPAESALVPRLMPAEQIASATSLLFAGIIAAQVAGTIILGPLFVKTIGPDPLFFLCIILFISAGVCFSLTGGGKAPAGARPTEKREFAGLRGSTIESWKLMRANRAVFLSAIQQTLIATTVVVLVSILPAYTKKVLHLPAENAVFIFLPAAVGVGLGYWLVPRLVRRRGKTTIAWLGFILFVLGLAALSFSTPVIAFMRDGGVLGPVGQTAPGFFYSPAIFCALMAGPMGFGYAVVLVAARLVTYEHIPTHMQGRIFAFQGVFTSVASIVPLIVAGALSALLGPRVVLGMLALAMVVAMLYAQLTLPRRAGLSLPAVRGGAGG